MISPLYSAPHSLNKASKLAGGSAISHLPSFETSRLRLAANGSQTWNNRSDQIKIHNTRLVRTASENARFCTLLLRIRIPMNIHFHSCLSLRGRSMNQRSTSSTFDIHDISPGRGSWLNSCCFRIWHLDTSSTL